MVRGKRNLLLVLILLIALLLVACIKGEELKEPIIEEIVDDASEVNILDESSLDRLNEYIIDVELNPTDMTYKGKQRIVYINKTGASLEEIYFHLYPNAFSSLEDAPILFNIGERMDKKTYTPGHISIEKVKLGGKDLEWSIEGTKDTILHVKLDEALEENEETEIYLEYTVKLPSTKDRFGFHDKGINLGNWYPIVAVYDDEGWNLDPYYKIGDPFYSELSNYKVSITVPKEYIVAASGKAISATEKDGKKNYYFEGELIRDFAWVASKDFLVKDSEIDGIKIKLYSVNKNENLVDEALKFAENSLRVFNRIFGQYPYEEYSVVITEFPSGMEYPTIVFISNDYFYKPMLSTLEKVIVHETAHQWWYGLVGNDQVDEAWLDESLASYSEVIYISEIYGKDKGEAYFNENIKLGYEYMLEYLEGDSRVNKSLSEFNGWDDYSLLVYVKGAVFLDEIKQEFGEDSLYKILNSYYERYKYQIASTEDFIRVCEDVTKTSFEPLANEYLYGNK